MKKEKRKKKQSVEVLGVLLFVGRNYKKIFLGKLGKVKKWKKRSVEAQVLTHYLRLKTTRYSGGHTFFCKKTLKENEENSQNSC